MPSMQHVTCNNNMCMVHVTPHASTSYAANLVHTLPHNVLSPCTGLTNMPMHIDVVSMTPHVSKPNTSGQHKVKVDAMVFVHLKQPNIVVPLATSNMGEGPPGHYKDTAGKTHYGMCGQELVQVLKDHLIPNIKRARGRSTYLVIDQHSAHRSVIARDFCHANGIELVLLPAHSPDLSPLDSHLFAEVKNRHDRLWPAASGPWCSRSTGLIELLLKENAEAHIMCWPRKLQAVLAANGHRLDHA